MEYFEKHHERVISVCREQNYTLTPQWIYVSISRQRLYFYEHNKLEAIFVISTSLYGVSSLKDSLGTPLGLHKIADKIGDDAVAGMVFIGRKSTGKVYTEYQDWRFRGYVTTRIIRLKGLEFGKNLGGDCDTYNRYIYIHGVSDESRIGMPYTHGCIGMLNHEIVHFYKMIKADSLLLIDFY